MRARPATPPTTPPAIAATFFEPWLTLEPGDAAVGELGIPTVTVVVITPLVAVVEAGCVELALLPARGEVATISPDAALAPQPIKYAPYKGSKKLASYECVTQCGRFELSLFFTQRTSSHEARSRSRSSRNGLPICRQRISRPLRRLGEFKACRGHDAAARICHCTTPNNAKNTVQSTESAAITSDRWTYSIIEP